MTALSLYCPGPGAAVGQDSGGRFPEPKLTVGGRTRSEVTCFSNVDCRARAGGLVVRRTAKQSYKLKNKMVHGSQSAASQAER